MKTRSIISYQLSFISYSEEVSIFNCVTRNNYYYVNHYEEQKNYRYYGRNAFLLLLNLLAMLFTDEVKWSLFDFVVAGVLMIGAGLMFELVMRKVNKIEYRIAIFVALLAALLLIWIEIAVGVFGTPFAGN